VLPIFHFSRVDVLCTYFKEFFKPRAKLIYYFAFCAHLMLNTLQIEKLQIVEVCCLMEIIKQVKSIDTPFLTMDVVHTNVPILQRCKLLPNVQKLPLRRLFVAEWAI
jgi:hypothetical protein